MAAPQYDNADKARVVNDFETVLRSKLKDASDRVIRRITTDGYLNEHSQPDWAAFQQAVEDELWSVFNQLQAEAVTTFQKSNLLENSYKKLLEKANNRFAELNIRIKELQKKWDQTPQAKQLQARFEMSSPNYFDTSIRLSAESQIQLTDLRIEILVLLVLFTVLAENTTDKIEQGRCESNINMLYVWLKQLVAEKPVLSQELAPVDTELQETPLVEQRQGRVSLVKLLRNFFFSNQTL